MFAFALDQIQASMEEGRRAKAAQKIADGHLKESRMQDYKMYRFRKVKQNIKTIAHFDDGYYTFHNDRWIKCDKEGNVKMTKEEATFKIQRKGFEGTRARELCDALEALGLFKIRGRR